MTLEASVAERERKARDLRQQLSELGTDLKNEVVFQHIRTRREPVVLYAMTDGEPITVPEYMAADLLNKRGVDGNFMFTDSQAEAPLYVRGGVKCFLHKDSAERAAGILGAIGLTGKVCVAGSLASEHAKDMHAQHRHKQEWLAMQTYLERQERQADRERQERQLEATLALARGATGETSRKRAPVTPEETVSCGVDGCEYAGTPRQVRGHQMAKHR